MQTMNPVLKRFLKGLIATMIASGIAYIIKVLPDMNLFSATITSLIVAGLLGTEKAVQGMQ